MTSTPDFFIAGAPKCGTTAMFTYLASHPDVFTPARKEPSYFARDLDPGSSTAGRFFTRDAERYRSLFADRNAEKRAGEGSVWYLYSEVAAREIKKFEPDARIIVMLRNPVDMMYSLHAHWVANGGEEITSFEEALALEGVRAEGEQIPRHAFVLGGLLYRRVAGYSDQVRRYIDEFGRDKVLVLLFEEFTADPAQAFRQVCDFLDIDSTFVPSLERVNQNTVVRNRALHNALRFHPKVPARMVPAALRRSWHRLKHKMLRANERAVAREPLDPQLRARLASQSAPEVRRLSSLLGRDLIAFWGMAPATLDAGSRLD